MTSLLTAAEKAQCEAAIASVADTFSRPLVIVRMAEQIVISDSPAHSFIWPQAPANTPTNVIPVTGVYQGRIWYERRQPLDLLNSTQASRIGSDQINVQVQDGTARLKLDPAGATFIAGAERVQFDGNTFTIESTARPHGVFTPQYYTYWLKRTQ